MKPSLQFFTDHTGVTVMVYDGYSGKGYSKAFIPIGECLQYAKQLEQFADTGKTGKFQAGKIVLGLTPDLAWSIATQLQLELSSIVVRAACELLSDGYQSQLHHASVIIGTREFVALQKAVQLKTGSHYGPIIRETS